MQSNERSRKRSIGNILEVIREHHKIILSLCSDWEKAQPRTWRKNIKYKAYLMNAEIGLSELIEIIEVKAQNDLKIATALASSLADVTLHLVYVSKIFESIKGLQVDEGAALTMNAVQSAAAEHARSEKKKGDDIRQQKQLTVMADFVGSREISKPTKFIDDHLNDIKKAGRAKNVDMPARSGMISLLKKLGHRQKKIQD